MQNEAVVPASHTSLLRYWRLPIFSGPWWRGRVFSVGAAVALFAAALAITIGIVADETLRGVRVFVELAMLPLVALCIGPGLAVYLRGLRWPPRREYAAMAAAICACSAVLFWADPWVERAVRAWIPTVPNKVVQFSFGLNAKVEADDGKPKEDSTQAAEPNPLFAASLVNALLYFWLSGGLALIAYGPQQRRLADDARRRELSAAQAARREAEMKLSILAAQVEPHFLFNTLAGVRGAVASDPARAVTLIDRLTDYLRLTIPRLRNDGQIENATLAPQMDIVESYLALTHARLPRLAYRIDLPPALVDARFPPLMLISLAENAVKHGIEPKVGPAAIEVTAHREGDRLTVAVCDDGVGFGAGGAGSGLGLANIRERLAQLYGSAAALELTAREDGGVCAAITLPFETTTTDADRPAR
jgi:hypothetical protein